MAAPKILIPFYSRTGTIERLANAIAEGAGAEGAEVRLRRAREFVSAEVMAQARLERTDRSDERQIPGPHA